MIGYLLVMSAVLSADGVQVETLDGQVQTGQLLALNRDGLALQTDTGRHEIAAETLVGMAALKAGRPKEKVAGALELLDRSHLSILEYRASAGKARVTLAGGAEVELPTRAINWVRLQPPADRSEKLAGQWSEMLNSKPGGDVLVVRSAALDYAEGVLGDVDEGAVKFAIDGDAHTVARSKVEGIVYFHAEEPESPDAVCKVTDIYASSLLARDVRLEEGLVKVVTTTGVSVAWPLEQVSAVDFSASKIQYLSNLEPDSFRYVPMFVLPTELAAVNEFYAPRRNVGFEQAPLQLDGKTYTRGLSLASRTTVAYRLPGKFRYFKAMVGIDDSMGDSGDVRLQIKADGRTLFDAQVRGFDAAKPLELDIQGVKRLELVVDYGEDLDVGDRLNLCDARVTK